MKANDKAYQEAADALEAVLAERDALKAELAAGNEWIQARATTLEELAMVRAERDALKAELIDYKDAAASEADSVNELEEKIRELNVESDKWESAYKEITDTRVKIEETTVDKLKKVESERDALLARLAPKDDEELVEIAAKVLQGGYELEWSVLPEEWKKDWRRVAQSAIDAIQPHIEAAERERCAKIAERYIGYDVSYCHSDSVRSAGYVTACRVIAAAIRSGK